MNILQGAIDGAGWLISQVLGVLPQSPFQNLAELIGNNPYMQFISWLIPMGSILAMFQAWLAAILVYYIAKVPLRWAKVIKS
jgi:hypothetical protein